jgi:hypothetical protein
VDPTGAGEITKYVPYYAKARLYGRRHLDRNSWNQMRLHGHLELAHDVKVDVRGLTQYHGSYKKSLQEIHLMFHKDHPEILEGLV